MKISKVILVCAISAISTVSFAQSTNRIGSSNNLPASGHTALQPTGSGLNVVVDGGFEGGTPNAAWTEASTNFGTTLCDIGSCGTGTGTGPNSGNFWSWFGGIGASEVGSVSQSFIIPNGTATLEFFTESIICDSAADYMEAQIDGNTVYRIQGDDPSCGSLGYAMQTVDVSAFADGANHTLTFTSEIFANNGGGSNFFLDDVSLTVVAPPAIIPSLQWYGLATLMLVLLTLGYRRVKS